MAIKARYNVKVTIELESADHRFAVLPSGEGLERWLTDTLQVDPPMIPADLGFRVRSVRCKATANAAASISRDKGSHVLG